MAAGYAYAGLAAYQIVSGFQQAELVRENAKLSREIGEMNAEAAELDAYNAEKDGMTQENRYQSVIDQTIGAQNVIFAANDVDANFGTAAELQAESKLTGALNQMDIRARAQAEALGYKNQAKNIRLQSYMNSLQSDVQATSIQNASIINAASTGLSGYEKTHTPASAAPKKEGGGSFYKSHITGEWAAMDGKGRSSSYLGDYNF
ncbi:MAG: hypothetical protein ACKOX6_18225 [Bdellovibrio sp.]